MLTISSRSKASKGSAETRDGTKMLDNSMTIPSASTLKELEQEEEIVETVCFCIKTKKIVKKQLQGVDISCRPSTAMGVRVREPFAFCCQEPCCHCIMPDGHLGVWAMEWLAWMLERCRETGVRFAIAR